ncbi:multicomponent Na+:H+ antiporter subunit D [Acetoanaerobium pronyense]|uniref:Multicomponent Na+:H+ antiporter subunit D n=1 Tax=Acetoanaerobium pronyense TaxID=1482736 RepID=A0ABS4KJD1_9FIRM|nr:proton-conducting transporter membrane subunit [Acetoanaerobium pronyense]MBP2027903.1 multicomponent Na+:H+ antiporter subunit D [Acetoanaerobium pronyense]
MNQSVLLIFLPIITSLIIYSFKNKLILSFIFINQIILSIIAYNTYFNVLENGEYKIVFGGYSNVIGIQIRVDMLASAFIILAVIIWWAVLLYSLEKIKKDHTFGFFLLFLEGVFLGFIQANDFFTVFVFIELITILATILIVYKKDGHSIRAGFYYLLFNSTGMMFYLLGLALLYRTTGTLNIELSQQILPKLNMNFGVQLAYVLMVASLGVKSAFFPVYNWLPKAHGAAPSSISALLSGLLVKSGVYAFIRIGLAFDTAILNDFFLYIGLLTSLGGTIFAISQKDLKQLLAFSTISQMGIMIIGVSTLSGYGFIGGVYHMFSHAFFKAILFLSSGYIIVNAKERRVTEIRGVFKTYPGMSILMILGLLSMVGFPMFGGYISKDIVKYSVKDFGLAYFLFSIANIGTIIYTLKIMQIFRGEKKEYKKDFKVYIGLLILTIPSILLGLNPLFIESIFRVRLVGFFGEFNFRYILEFLGYFGFGFIIYKIYVENEHPIFKKLRHFNITFETSVFMLIGFVFSMIVYIYI